METFDQGFIVRQLMNRDVQECKDYSSVIAWVHIDFRTWEGYLLQSRLEFWIHFLHELLVEVRHLLAVIDCRWWSSLMQVLNAIDPS